ncbi:MAG: hypothetical protein IT276_01185 [Ignavibacteriaceae bacterium]|nr:hypothetical protein [Ignavibacteriaceae bacterium]HRN27123.1 hypothetical protein [Ignavibacteriaceae bacterium]HRP91866.1 hypothetical protein [Ignavibacteriaceae bacterium]HRQ55286.1 hypothetical protein [Ignavibacteriaceae bacterium]
MKKVKVELENCYGIKKLKHEFSFEPKRTYSIYSPNGVMKTSFAKTFKDLSMNVESKDMVFTENKSKRSIKDETGKELKAENIFVIEPYNETYKSERVSTLLVNSKLRNEFEKININIDEKKSDLLDSLKPLSGIRSGIEEIISNVFTKLDNAFFKAIVRIKDEVLDKNLPVYEGVVYKNIFSDKTEQFLSSKDTREKIQEYINKYDELIEHSKYLKKGIFNHTNAATIAKNLKDNGFFQASHSVNLISGKERKEIKTEKELQEVIEKEKQDILTNPELVSIFDDLDKKIIKNQDLRDFREYLLQNIGIVPELSNLEAFKEKLWISYLKLKKDLFVDLLEEYEKGKKELEEIIEQAKNERTQWSTVIDIFNSRFSVPFKLSIGNQDQVILSALAPVVKFDFIDKNKSKTINEKELLTILSTGEKRALYLLNIIFEVEARKTANIETLFVLDDIADSFDYKNKYAIIEYLKDISEYDHFYQIILSHNYDFFRTVSSRLDMQRANKLNTDKSEVGITIFEEKYQNNPFTHWKTKLDTDDSMLVASIPFVRNLSEFTGDDATFKKLTSLLHYKVDTDSITIKELENILKAVLKDKQAIVLPDNTKKIVDKIFFVADTILADNSETLELENKVCLAIAIRLKAEIFMVKKINDNAFWNSITINQSNALLEKYIGLFPSEFEKINLLKKVNLMTPENIHINSFMYEPILDMSNHHLKTLYSEVKAL